MNCSIKLITDTTKYQIRSNETYKYDEKRKDILAKIKDCEFIIDENIDPFRSGTYGYVFLADKKSDQSKNIIKIFRDDMTSADIINEISCLMALRKYPNFPKISHVVETNNGYGLAMITNYCGKEFKHHRIKNYNSHDLAIQFIKLYFILENEHIVHRDIKNNNICIDNNGIISIIDFGYARKFPLFSPYTEVIAVNRHIESLALYYNIDYSKKIDLMSIFNILLYIFNADNIDYSYHAYPLEIDSSTEQLYNIVYFLLCTQNTEKKRVKIYKMICKIVNYQPPIKNIKENDYGIKFSMTLKEFHDIFTPSVENNIIYMKYAVIKKNIPVQFYRAMRKLLNINPRKRISYRVFYYLINKTEKIKNNLELAVLYNPYIKYYSNQNIFADEKYFCANNDNYKYLLTDFMDYPTKIYSLAYYRFFNIMGEFAKEDHQILLRHILFIYYNTTYESIEPDFMKFTFDMPVFMKYMNICNFNFHADNPYNYLENMKLFRWNPETTLLFDYFITIAATNHFFATLHPYVLCLIINIFIYRIGNKIPIEIDQESEYVFTPVKTINALILNKKTLNLLLQNPYCTKLLNKFYGYYAKLVLENKLININVYYIGCSEKIKEYIKFYKCQIEKFRCAKSKL